jgi:hypothetical protein
MNVKWRASKLPQLRGVLNTIKDCQKNYSHLFNSMVYGWNYM